MNDPKASTRKTIVESVKTLHHRPGDALFPDFLFKNDSEPVEVWELFITTRTGLLPSDHWMHICYSEEDAKALEKRFPVGCEVEEYSAIQGIAQWRMDFIRSAMEGRSFFGVRAGDEESPLAFDVLYQAGIYQKRYGQISQTVIDFLGKQRTGELKNRFRENWRVAAAFEYCWLRLSHSSPAFMAASYQYHYYITKDDFSAGYYWRDLEIMVHGVETEAQKAIEMRKKAGDSGSKKSAQSREMRRRSLLTAIEDVAKRNPEILKLGEKALVKLATSQAAESEPALWRQGKGQTMEYLGEIRRGEAGAEMKARYQELIWRKPPKRFE